MSENRATKKRSNHHSSIPAENVGVSEKTIARDALGLLKEVKGRHKELLVKVFDFLKTASVKANTSELAGSKLPLILLPVFFYLQTTDPRKLRHIAIIFHEIIMEAPDYLKNCHSTIISGDINIFQRILNQELVIPSLTLFNLSTVRVEHLGENNEWRIRRILQSRLHPWLGHPQHN